MQLQCEDTFRSTLFRVFVGADRSGDAVDLVSESEAGRGDVVLVPVLLLDLGLDLFGVADFFNDLRLVVCSDDGLVASQRQDATEAFAVVDAGVGVAGFEVGLIAADDPFFLLDFNSGDFEVFCAAGDENGLFIILNKEKRRWFPTDDIPHSSYFRVEGDYNIEFTNGKINRI